MRKFIVCFLALLLLFPVSALALDSPTNLRQMKIDGSNDIRAGYWYGLSSIQFRMNKPIFEMSLFPPIPYPTYSRVVVTNTQAPAIYSASSSADNQNYSIINMTLPDGRYSWKAQNCGYSTSSYVEYNNDGPSSMDFGVDTTKPTIATMSTMDTAKYYRGNILLKPGTLSDQTSGVAGVEYYFKNDVYIGCVFAAPFYLSWNTSSSKINGTFPVFFVPFDQVNNYTISSSQNLHIDNTKPKTLAPYKKTIKAGQVAHMYWKVSDAYTGNKATVSLKLQKKSGTKYSTVKYIRYGLTTINQLRRYSMKINTKGNYRFLVYAKDRAGNIQDNVAANYVSVI